MLTELQAELLVDILFVFQPAEEEIRNSGAGQMKDHPLVRRCDRLIGLHIWGDMEAGTATLESGPVMVASDTFRVEIRGRGGHGAAPRRSAQSIRSRRVAFSWRSCSARSRGNSTRRPRRCSA
nr:M20/M25/M40 family metallo-hydrolase [Stomatobaculum longum]